MTSLLPALLKTTYRNEPIFQNAQIVYSAYNCDKANASFAKDFEAKAAANGLSEICSAYFDGTSVDLHAGAAKFSEGTIIGEEGVSSDNITGPCLPYQAELSNRYLEFYEELLSATEENV